LARYYSSNITNASKIILQEAENFTYQRLLTAEENLKEDINKFSKKINEISLNVKNAFIKIDEYERRIRVLSRELEDWEKNEKQRICIKENIIRPTYPNDSLLSGRNLISLILAIPLAILLGKKNGMLALFFVPAFFFIIRILMNVILKNSDEVNLGLYHKQLDFFNNELEKKLKPTEEYLNKKKLLKDYQINLLPKIKTVKSHLEIEGRDLRTKIVVFKKTLQGFKYLKRKANERERTAKINAFESKNRSGAQLIKDKLLKLVKSKNDWLCIYCLKLNNVELAEADHIHPVNKGGLTTMQNMVLICKDCNSKKSNQTLRVFCKKSNLNYDKICERLEALGKDV
jgi:5-methylcytosine-specific restriction endonuclease McrA